MAESDTRTAWQVAPRLARTDGVGQALAVAPRLRVLFVGRRPTAAALAALIAGLAQTAPNVNGAGMLAAEIVELVTLTNQRAALEEIRSQPPKIVVVEVEGRRQNRARFVEMVRYRLPSAMILAVSTLLPPLAEGFDRVLQLPLVAAEVLDALHSASDEFAGHVIQRGPIRLNVATRTVVTPNGQRHMTPKQCALLQYLLKRANEIISRKDIMEAVWETDYLEDTRTLDVHVRWLRECIEPDPSNPVYLLTVRGKGYHLRLP